jgi:hypothetical protein
VFFVERLSDLQGALRRKAEPIVRLALERGEIVKQWRRLRRRFLLFDFNDAGLVETFLPDSAGDLAEP